MATFTCSCCRRVFRMNPRLKQQHYCKRSECQRTRRRKWQRMKMATDPDYQSNQQEAQKKWCERNPDYWRHYRSRRIRSQKTSPADWAGGDAKMDTLSHNMIIISGFGIRCKDGRVNGKNNTNFNRLCQCKKGLDRFSPRSELNWAERR